MAGESVRLRGARLRLVDARTAPRGIDGFVALLRFRQRSGAGELERRNRDISRRSRRISWRIQARAAAIWCRRRAAKDRKRRSDHFSRCKFAKTTTTMATVGCASAGSATLSADYYKGDRVDARVRL